MSVWGIVRSKQLVDERKERGKVMVQMFDTDGMVYAVPVRARDDGSQRPKIETDVGMINKPPESKHQKGRDEVRLLHPEKHKHGKISHKDRNVVESVVPSLRRSIESGVSVMKLMCLPQKVTGVLQPMYPILPNVPKNSKSNSEQ